MADTYTTNLSLTKPEIGGSTDTWGNKLNANTDAIDALFPSGDLSIANGGTGASDASTARSNLGLGTMATQNASAVAITGGTASIDSVSLISTSPYLKLEESDAPVDNRKWVLTVNGQQLQLAPINDAWTLGTAAFTITRSGASPSVVNFGTTVQVSGNAVYHAGNLSAATITESQITDGSLLARVGSNETVTGSWSFSTVPSKTSAGKFLHYASSSYTGGAVTVSTVDPSGVPGEGDRWVKYQA